MGDSRDRASPNDLERGRNVRRERKLAMTVEDPSDVGAVRIERRRAGYDGVHPSVPEHDVRDFQLHAAPWGGRRRRRRRRRDERIDQVEAAVRVGVEAHLRALDRRAIEANIHRRVLHPEDGSQRGKRRKLGADAVRDDDGFARGVGDRHVRIRDAPKAQATEAVDVDLPQKKRRENRVDVLDDAPTHGRRAQVQEHAAHEAHHEHDKRGHPPPQPNGGAGDC